MNFFYESGIETKKMRGSNEVVLKVLDGKSDEVLLGFGWEGQVKRYGSDEVGPRYDVLWRSNEMPLGGLGIAMGIPEWKRMFLRDVAQQVVASKTVKPPEEADIEAYGACADFTDIVGELDKLPETERKQCLEGWKLPDGE